MKKETLVLTSKALAEKYYDLHILYDFPIKCLRCQKNVRIKSPLHKYVYVCDCRELIFAYPCGVHVG